MTNDLDMNIFDSDQISGNIDLNNNLTNTGIYTISGFNGLSNSDFSYGDIQISYPNDPYRGNGSLVLTGENADIDINGTSLKAFMVRIEERLALLTPNTKLESEWAELKALGDQYRQLEKDIRSKMQTWDILSKE